MYFIHPEYYNNFELLNVYNIIFFLLAVILNVDSYLRSLFITSHALVLYLPADQYEMTAGTGLL